MAWVKVNLKNQAIIEMPLDVYNNMFKGNDAFSIIEEPKPNPEVIKSEEVEQNGLQQSNKNEVNNIRKSTKKSVK